MASNETCIIQTTDGDVCGYIDKNEKGTCYYKFKKIPYAKPPLGQLRFQVRNFHFHNKNNPILHLL